MTPAEKRKFIRLDSLHLLDYLIIDDDGNEGEYSMGRTLDVSLNGMKIETIHSIPSRSQLVITLGIEDELVDIKGSVAHTQEAENRYVSGVEFNKVSAEDRSVLRRYVDEFKARKEALLQRDDFPPLHAKAI